MKKDLMRNFSFSIYKATHNRYITFKNKKKLTHDEAMNILLDVYEKEEANNEIRDAKTKSEQDGKSKDYN